MSNFRQQISIACDIKDSGNNESECVQLQVVCKPESASETMRILVIEDEVDIQQALVQSLAENGFAVDSAFDGVNGLDKALTWPYDLIVLDIMLPLMDGWTVLQQLRKVKSTPVLVLTARDAIDDRIRGLDHGADDYLVKPFALEELHARIKAIIRRCYANGSSVIEIGDLKIDLAKKLVFVQSINVELTAREYSLLELLILNRGRLVSRSLIYDHVFGENDATLSNLVDVHISHIRKKLGADIIKTRRGQGYIVEE